MARNMLSSIKIYKSVIGVVVRRCHQDACSIGEKDLRQAIQLNATEEASDFVRKGVPFSHAEYQAKRDLPPCQPVDPHILKVAILGEPNVGKSTLTNRLMKWKVCSVSKKVHTTRKKSSLILVEDNKQIVFLDTPGYVTPEHSIKHHLEVSLVADPEESVRRADLIAVIADAKNKWTNKRINEEILRLLKENKEKKSILILNKIDAQKNKMELLTVAKVLSRGARDGLLVDPVYKEKAIKNHERKKKHLSEIFERTEKVLSTENTESDENVLTKPLEHFEGAKGWPFFSDVFMVSALNGDGVDTLRDYMFSLTKPGEWLYHESNVMDTHPYEVAIMTVREVFLEDLPDEIPYNLTFKIKEWSVDDANSLKIDIAIYCPKPRHKTLIIGKSGKRIGMFVEKTRQALQDTFRAEIKLGLSVHVLPDKTLSN